MTHAGEAIVEYLRGKRVVTVKDVAENVYPEIVPWSNVAKGNQSTLSYRMQWAHEELQRLNAKKDRKVYTNGSLYSLTEVPR